MRTGELAEKSGPSRDTIRFYERKGLITSRASESATNNYRNYPEVTLRLLDFLSQAREAGMSAADLRGCIEAAAGSCAPEVGRSVIQDKIAELTARAAQIRSVIAFLTRTLEDIDACDSQD